VIIAISVILLMALLFVGMPIAVAMGLTGMALLYHMVGDGALLVAAKVMFDTLNDTILLAIPLFILMGAIMMKGGVGERLFELFDAFLGHVPGGVGIATVLTCAVLAAMCGSSVGIAAAVGGVAINNLAKRGYSLELSLGLPSSAGGLGILMPASVGMILYSSITDTSVAKLLMAGLIPAIIIVVLFSVYTVWAFSRSENRPLVPKKTWVERWQAFKVAIWALTIPIFLLAGIYTGIATVTEIAGVACLWSVIVCVFIYHSITWKDILPILRYGLSTATMVMFLVATAMFLGNALTQMGIPDLVKDFFVGQDIPVWAFLGITMLFLIILGTALEGASMLLMTMPVLTPILHAYNYDLIAYAVLFCINVELSLLSPPVGLTVQTVEGIAKHHGLPVTSATAWRGCLPFFFLYLAVMVLVAVFPSLALWIPSQMR